MPSADRKPARQLIFDLARAPSYDADDFLVSPSNEAAHRTIELWPDWPERVMLLLGPAGAGKSHLAAIWAAAANARLVRPGQSLDLADWRGPPVAVIEDADRAHYPEAALFHLLNAAREGGGSILITARTPPDQWQVRTPDLLSRLRLAPSVPIGEPDRTLICAVIVKLFADRQIRIEEDIVAYAALYCDRSLDAVARFVAAVDDEALASGRRITRQLAARTLAAITGESGTTDHAT